MMTTEDLPNGKFQLNIWDEGHWDRHQFDTKDEMEIYAHQRRTA